MKADRRTISCSRGNKAKDWQREMMLPYVSMPRWFFKVRETLVQILVLHLPGGYLEITSYL